MALTKIDDRGLKTPIELQDNEKIRLGTGNDLQIFHDGTDSIIDFLENPHNLRIRGDGELRLEARYNELSIRAVKNGTVELYYDNAVKLETITSGLRVHGSNLYIGNSGENLRLHHNNNDSYIDSRVGSLYLRTTPGGVNALKAVWNAQVELYYANVKKAETVSGGFTVTGVCTATSFAGDGSNLTGISSVGGATGVDFNDNIQARFGTGNDLKIYHSGAHSYIEDAGTGALILVGSQVIMQNSAQSENMFAATENGSIALYNDGSKKFETTAKGAYINDNFLGVNVGSPSGTPDGRNAFLALGDSDTGIAQNGDGQLEAWANNQLRLLWTSGDIHSYATIRPASGSSVNLGTASYRWQNIYTNDLNLSNEGSSNDIDGSWGDWTIQEGESDLFLKNNRSGKKYKFNLTEVS